MAVALTSPPGETEAGRLHTSSPEQFQEKCEVVFRPELRQTKKPPSEH
jgi:hypothetical protein